MDRESIKSESEMQKSAEKMHSIKYMLYNIEAHKKVIIHLYGSDLILNLNADDFEFEKKWLQNRTIFKDEWIKWN